MEILDAATQLFSELGYAAARTQTLADRLQVGKGTVYRYFPTKRDLFLAAVDRAMLLLREEVDRVVADVADPYEKMCRAIHAYLTFFAARPEYVELLIQERALFKDREKPTYFAHREVNIGRWCKLFETMIGEGRVRAVPVEQMIETIGDMLYGTMVANYFVRRDRGPEEQAKVILDLVLRGVLTDAERARLEKSGELRGALGSGGQGGACQGEDGAQARRL